MSTILSMVLLHLHLQVDHQRYRAPLKMKMTNCMMPPQYKLTQLFRLQAMLRLHHLHPPRGVSVDLLIS